MIGIATFGWLHDKCVRGRVRGRRGGGVAVVSRKKCCALRFEGNHFMMGGGTLMIPALYSRKSQMGFSAPVQTFTPRRCNREHFFQEKDDHGFLPFCFSPCRCSLVRGSQVRPSERKKKDEEAPDGILRRTRLDR